MLDLFQTRRERLNSALYLRLKKRKVFKICVGRFLSQKRFKRLSKNPKDRTTALGDPWCAKRGLYRPLALYISGTLTYRIIVTHVICEKTTEKMSLLQGKREKKIYIIIITHKKLFMRERSTMVLGILLYTRIAVV